MSDAVAHASADEMVLQWRVKSDPGVPEREWKDTTVRQPRWFGSQNTDETQAARMLAEWRKHYFATDEEQRVVNRITHVTDYAVE